MVKSSSSFELDFFSMAKESKGLPPPVKAPIFQRRRSFRDIQGVISKMNPEVVKSVIENGSLAFTPNGTQTYLSPMPRHHPKFSVGENKAPMTIFYNGRVLVYDVSPHQAKDIVNVAHEILPKSLEKSDSDKNLLGSLNGDFPILRRNSLERFFGEAQGKDLMQSQTTNISVEILRLIVVSSHPMALSTK